MGLCDRGSASQKCLNNKRIALASCNGCAILVPLSHGGFMITDDTVASTEEWRPIPSLSGFEASNIGRIRRTFGNGNTRIVSGILHVSGYLRIITIKHGKRSCKRVHRLVCEAFLGACPKGYHVNHKDGVKTNNRLSNLEYVTPLENIRHAWRTGLVKPHIPSRFVYPRKLSDEAIQFIHENNGKLTQAEIAKTVGVSAMMVSKVQRGYKHCTSYVATASTAGS